MSDKPNIVIIMSDQQRADMSAREGFPLDTTPFLDDLAARGAWFDRAYTSMPVCAPARVSMFTGRYPNATRVRTNHNLGDVTYETDLVDVLRSEGYATAMCGKNHSHLTADRVDHWFELSHEGGRGDGRTDDEIGFDDYLAKLCHRTDVDPTPFPVECQGPYRAVSAAQQWIETVGGQPFFLWLTFAEPHNPFQVPEPYYSMFPPEQLPPTRSSLADLATKGFKFEQVHDIGKMSIPEYDEQIARTRANYCGMLRLIDDQVRRFVEFLDASGVGDNTIVVFLSDHGDFAGEYGLIRKGPELPEVLTRIPMQWTGPGIVAGEEPLPAHVSIVDVMPTLCEAIGVDLPVGVQGRSLWPMLTGADYPREEFASAYAEHGFGGLHYTADDDRDPIKEGALNPGCTFDCLNCWSQSGQLRMVRKGDWKLAFDMQGRGQLYDLSKDPVELDNLFGRPEVADIERELLADLLAWTLRVQDPLPLARWYRMKTDPRNYWATYQ